MLNRYHLIKYESLISNTKQEIEAACQLADIDCAAVLTKLEGDRTFSIGHLISGNPVIKSRTHIRIESGVHQKWIDAFPLSLKLTYFLLTLPVNIIYGYDIKGGSPRYPGR